MLIQLIGVAGGEGRIDNRLELEWVMGYGGERNLGNLKLLGRGQLLYSAGLTADPAPLCGVWRAI